MNWAIRLVMCFAAMAVLLAVTEITRRRLHAAGIVTRKVIHTSVGVLMLLTPVIFQSKYPVLLVAVMLFAIDLFVVRFSQRLGKEYRTHGVLYYPAVLFFLTLLCWDRHIHVLMGAVCVMSFGDGLSAFVGTWIGKHPFTVTRDRKTLEGSAAMYLASAVTLYVVLLVFTKEPSLSLAAALLVPVVATVVEAASSSGLDNVTVPLSAAALIYYLYSRTPPPVAWLAASMPLAAAASFMAYSLGALTAGGSVAAFVLGTLALAIGRLNGAMALLTFFLTSSLLSGIGRGRKAGARALSDKGSRRDLAQAFANGGVPVFLLLAGIFNPCSWPHMFFLAALASATSDTWATEIGTLSKAKALSLKGFARVPAGTSGAVSLLGTMGGAAGACLIALYAGFYGRAGGFNPFAFTAVALSGFAGCVLDSILGATVQAQYISPEGCLSEVGLKGSRTARGIPWIKNDMVNFLSAAFAAVVCFFMFLTLGPHFCQ